MGQNKSSARHNITPHQYALELQAYNEVKVTHMLDVAVVRAVVWSGSVERALVEKDSCSWLRIHFNCYCHQLGVLAEP